MKRIQAWIAVILLLSLCSCAPRTEDVVLFDPLATTQSVSPETESSLPHPTTGETTLPTTETTNPATAEATQPTTEATEPEEEETRQPEPPAPTEAPANDKMVWIPTKGGKKYHKKQTCSGMNEPDYVTKSEAEDLGFTPCKKCYK